MAELVKTWNDGGSLSVAYDGDRDGSAVFSSDAYEGIDREMTVAFKGGGLSVERKVRQEGIRQRYVTSDGLVFRISNGGRYGVLQEQSPYTELEYLESTGTQYIDLGIVFRNTDECYAEVAMMTSVTDKFFISPSKWNDKSQNRFALGGCYGNAFDIGYGGKGTAFTQFSPTTPVDSNKHIFTYKDMLFTMEDIGCTVDVSSVAWNGDTMNLLLFYGYNAPTACRVYCYRQYRDGAPLIDLIPVLDKEDVPCMYDKVSGQYFYNIGSGSFSYGLKS